MSEGVAAVLAGLGLSAAALWTVGPLWTLIPAVLLVGFGLNLDDGRAR
jgi:hypothetical protein